MKTFDKIKTNDIISFYDEHNMTDSAIVTKVYDNKFEAITNRYFNKNGVRVIYTFHLRFYKTGTKTNHRYLYGNAIEIIGNI